MTAFDVAIVGGGLAGNLLARQLRRRLPDLCVGLFERETATAYKVGEATVEITANYLTRKLGLTQYLYENQLPKNGLRYFFDTAERDAPLEEMSEVGSINLPFHPAFQIDRAAMEADLQEMNRNDGVDVRTGTPVGRIRFGTEGTPHRFETIEDGVPVENEARWLVDAAGRTGLFARLRDLRVTEPSHHVGSVWGRFESVADIDSLGAETFHARVRHTSRRLSTIHFLYAGYWIWCIPLRGGITSVGVTGAFVTDDPEVRTPEGFCAFLLRHTALAQLLSAAKLLDLGCYRNIAYGTRCFVHPDRWGLTGEAATSADPLYSPGGDFIALENDLLTDLIERDLAGESIAERCGAYDELLQFRHEAAMLLYRGLYGTLGSFELAVAKWDFDIGCYYNLWVQAYMRDEHLDLEKVRTQLRLRGLVLPFLKRFSELFQHVETSLHERGHYFRANTGRFQYGLENIDFTEAVGTDRSPDEVMAKTLDLFNIVRAEAMEILGHAGSYREVEPVPLAAFLPGRELW